MRRLGLVVVGLAVSLVFSASGASGATLSIIPGATTYTVGDTISLEIHPVVGDDCFDCMQIDLFAELTIAAMGSVTALSTSQNAISYDGIFVPMIGDPEGSAFSGPFFLSSLNLANLEVVNQNSFCTGFDWECYYIAPNPLATATFTATSPGQVTFGFNASTFNFFDAAPTSTATIEILPIPEPATSLLFTFGIIGMSVRRRHS